MSKWRLMTESHGDGCEYDTQAIAEQNATWLSCKLGERVFIRHKGKVIGSIFASQEACVEYGEHYAIGRTA